MLPSLVVYWGGYSPAMKVSLRWDCEFPTTQEHFELRGRATRSAEAFWVDDAHSVERSAASSAGKEGKRRSVVVLNVHMMRSLSRFEFSVLHSECPRVERSRVGSSCG